MARWLVDTDVLIDVALSREPFFIDSSALMDLLRERNETLFVAWHTISNLYYNVGSPRDAAFAKSVVADLMTYAQVAPTATDDLRYALGLPMSDFEDAMQVAAARACQADYIVTRNEGDFARSPIPTLTPTEALAELSR